MKLYQRYYKEPYSFLVNNTNLSSDNPLRFRGNSNLKNDNKYSFYKYYHDSEKFNNIYFKSKYLFLFEFFNDLNKFNNLKTNKQTKNKHKRKQQLCFIQLHNYIMNCLKSIMINTMDFQTLKK